MICPPAVGFLLKLIYAIGGQGIMSGKTPMFKKEHFKVILPGYRV